MKPTWTLTNDINDTRQRTCMVEEEQEENMKSLIGLEMWGWLEQMEYEVDNNGLY